jgi:hypothetical protein
MVFCISFFLVKMLAQPGTQSVQTNAFDLACGTLQSHGSPQSPQTHSQWRQPGLLGPGTQKSSHLQPQQMTSTFFSSQTSRQTFWPEHAQPQWAQQQSPSANAPAAATRTNMLAMTKAVDFKVIDSSAKKIDSNPFPKLAKGTGR